MAITSTGVRGFLQWLQRDQPGIYQKIAPQLPKIAPHAFSDATRRLGALRSIYKHRFATRSAPQRIGDYSSYASAPSVDYSASLSAPIASATVDYTSQLSAPASYTTSAVGAAPASLYNMNTGSVANTANTGTASIGTTNAIASAVNAVAGTMMNSQSAAALANLVSSQLSRAANGTTPANVSSTSLGIPTTSAGPSTSTLVLLALAAGAAYVVFS